MARFSVHISEGRALREVIAAARSYKIYINLELQEIMNPISFKYTVCGRNKISDTRKRGNKKE